MRNTFTKIYEYFKKNFSFKEFIIDFFIIAVIFFIATFNLPYVIYKPGGTIRLEDRIYIDGKLAEPRDYNLAYVSVAKSNIPSYLAAKVIKNWDIKKIEDVTIQNMDYETTFKIEQADLKNSIDSAIIVAYNKAGKKVEYKSLKFIIYNIDENANTDLEVLDEIISLDGKKYDNMDDFKAYINTLDVGTKVSLKVKNDGKEKDRYAYVYEYEDKKIIGILVHSNYEIGTTPKIEIKSKSSEAGASGGLMLTLAIYDSITDGDLTSGKKIVGTGTISEDGRVGAIGGVKYKMLGAEKEKADVFFVPEGNYEEAKKVYDKFKLKFNLVKVEKFDDAVEYLLNS